MLSEGWVAEEGKYLLPPRITNRWVWLIGSCDHNRGIVITHSRTNLVVCYLSMLLVTLINCGLRKVKFCDPLVRLCDALVDESCDTYSTRSCDTNYVIFAGVYSVV